MDNLNPLSSIYERASLVPAAAVIPAPIAYIIVAVKKFVVGFHTVLGGVVHFGVRTGEVGHFAGPFVVPFIGCQ